MEWTLWATNRGFSSPLSGSSKLAIPKKYFSLWFYSPNINIKFNKNFLAMTAGMKQPWGAVKLKGLDGSVKTKIGNGPHMSPRNHRPFINN